MSLLVQIDQDLVTAMKEKDEIKVSTLRMLKSALKNFEIQKKTELEDADTIKVIQSQIKSRNDSIELYKKGNREELAQKEEKEVEILKNYLPQQLSEEEIRTKVTEIIKEVGAQNIQDMGKVMGKASGEFKGTADMSLVSQIVKESLS
ncbi:MAG: GatB/YqeY domain-containing protein [Patescibacteria group bacterium]|nr:GatB/YqeY domain-containing protein [Patescibacteria group bacterium]